MPTVDYLTITGLPNMSYLDFLLKKYPGLITDRGSGICPNKHFYKQRWAMPSGMSLKKLWKDRRYSLEGNPSSLSPDELILYKKLMAALTFWPKTVRITRLDVAIDYFGYDLNSWRLDWIGKARTSCWYLSESKDVKTVYFGTRESDGQIKVYNKAKKEKQGGYWWRCEVTLRDEDIGKGNPFDGLCIYRLSTDKLPVKEAALVCYLQDNPHRQKELKLDWRQKKDLKELTDKTRILLDPQPAAVYERDLESLNDQLRDL